MVTEIDWESDLEYDWKTTLFIDYYLQQCRVHRCCGLEQVVWSQFNNDKGIERSLSLLSFGGRGERGRR